MANPPPSDVIAVQREYHKWDAAHSTMKDTPPSDGRDYIRHAQNLLPFLQAIAEFHPFAKGAIASFKAVIEYEQNRRENELRVTAVFLAQTDTMRVVLDLSNLRSRNQSDTDALKSTAMLEDVFQRIRRAIRACANSIDTYYKESRFVKFWRSQDWKDRMLGYIEEFNGYRVLLMQGLSIEMATGVDSLVSKMDTMLSRLFTPKLDWEKDLIIKTRALGDVNTWVRDSSTLQSLVSAANDPSVSLGITMDSEIESTRDGILLSLNTLCERNMETFELKLDLHTRQLQESIEHSAQYVVRTLSGPHDRLFHEDLKELWKEMSWIFCIENRFFSSALFEYFRDRLSAARMNDTNEIVQATSSTDEPLADTSSAVQKSDDGWTLEYIANFGYRISAAIDCDNSGFIRISEANTFTEQMPQGWTLPQWCAYTAAGYMYETRIYRKRMRNIISRMVEMQAQVLAVNRRYVFVGYVVIDYIFGSLALEPKDQQNAPIPMELRNLVKEKIKSQDTVFRAHLLSINWTIEDELTVRLIYRNRPVETYVHQLLTLVMEHTLEYMEACCTMTLDIKELWRIIGMCNIVYTISQNRISELIARFEKEPDSKNTLQNYYGGTWSLVDAKKPFTEALDALGDPDPVKQDVRDVEDFYLDVSVLDEFLPTRVGATPYLKYPPWEEYIKSLNASEIPSAIPSSWNPVVKDIEEFARDDFLSEFPCYEILKCDWCHKTIVEKRYHACIECLDLDHDLCGSCYNLPASDPVKLEKSKHSRPCVMKATLLMSPGRRQWLGLEGKLTLEEESHAANTWQRRGAGNASESTSNPEPQNGEEDSIANELTPNPESQNGEEDSPAGESTSKPGSQNGEEDSTAIESTSNPGPQNGEDNNPNEIPDDSRPPESEPIMIRKERTCGRCSDSISFDSTYYKCLGHLCRDYYLCAKCEPDLTDLEGHQHKWWHSLLIIPKNYLATEDAAKLSETTSTAEDASTISKDKTGEETTLSISSLNERISGIEAKLDSTRQALEDRLTATMATLEDRVTRLEAKLDTSVEELKQLLMQVLSNRTDL